MNMRQLFLWSTLFAALVFTGCGANGDGDGDEVTQAAVESSGSTQSPTSLTTVSATPSTHRLTLQITSTTAGLSSNELSTTIDSTTTTEPPTTALLTTEPVTTSEAVTQPTAAESTTSVTEAETTVPVAQVVDAERELVAQDWSVMATFAEVVLLHPSNRVERVGFHESNHDGARQMEPSATAVNPLVLESRSRDTGSRTAADVVVDPNSEIRAPVTGTVIRAGGYILYCKHNDGFVVIEPDSHPGWEVKVLHISGVAVTKGDRVEAGVTVLAPAPTPLPFDSQVDEFTAEPSWPHVHIEIVDPSIPDRPSPGGGGC